MNLSLSWCIQPNATCAYAGYATAAGLEGLNADLSAALKEPLSRLRTVLARLDNEPAFWKSLIVAACRSQRLPSAAWSCLRREGGEELSPVEIELVNCCLEEIEARVKARLPLLSPGELDLRSRPLREQWEARGPGMMHWLEKHLAIRPAPEPQVILFHPLRGGHGLVLPPHAAVGLEAVLVNPCEALPEIVRLAWLLSQLPRSTADGGLPRPEAESRQSPDEAIGKFTILLATLRAAEYVELCRLDAATLRLAASQWRIDLPEGMIEPRDFLPRWRGMTEQRLSVSQLCEQTRLWWDAKMSP